MADFTESDLDRAIAPFLQQVQEKAERETAEAKTLIERHYQNPSRETLKSLQTLQNKNHERVKTATQQRDNLHQMMLDLQAKLATLEQKWEEAKTSKDEDKAAHLQFKYQNFSESLEMTKRMLKEAEETLEQCLMLVAREKERLERAEQHLERAEQHLLALEAENP